MVSLHIIETESALEAQALRATAEALGFVVSVTWVGNSGQIVDFLSQEPSHELIFICGHGDERGVLLPPLAEEVKARFPFDDVITPSDFGSFVRLRGNVVLSSGCVTGTEEMARAFLENGAECFIGAADYPDGDEALLFCLHFLFVYWKTRSGKEAFELANRQVEGENRFCFFESVG